MLELLHMSDDVSRYTHQDVLSFMPALNAETFTRIISKETLEEYMDKEIQYRILPPKDQDLISFSVENFEINKEGNITAIRIAYKKNHKIENIKEIDIADRDDKALRFVINELALLFTRQKLFPGMQLLDEPAVKPAPLKPQLPDHIERTDEYFAVYTDMNGNPVSFPVIRYNKETGLALVSMRHADGSEFIGRLTIEEIYEKGEGQILRRNSIEPNPESDLVERPEEMPAELTIDDIMIIGKMLNGNYNPASIFRFYNKWNSNSEVIEYIQSILDLQKATDKISLARLETLQEYCTVVTAGMDISRETLKLLSEFIVEESKLVVINHETGEVKPGEVVVNLKAKIAEIDKMQKPLLVSTIEETITSLNDTFKQALQPISLLLPGKTTDKAGTEVVADDWNTIASRLIELDPKERRWTNLILDEASEIVEPYFFDLYFEMMSALGLDAYTEGENDGAQGSGKGSLDDTLQEMRKQIDRKDLDISDFDPSVIEFLNELMNPKITIGKTGTGGIGNPMNAPDYKIYQETVSGSTLAGIVGSGVMISDKFMMILFLFENMIDMLQGYEGTIWDVFPRTAGQREEIRKLQQVALERGKRVNFFSLDFIVATPAEVEFIKAHKNEASYASALLGHIQATLEKGLPTGFSNGSGNIVFSRAIDLLDSKQVSTGLSGADAIALLESRKKGLHLEESQEEQLSYIDHALPEWTANFVPAFIEYCQKMKNDSTIKSNIAKSLAKLGVSIEDIDPEAMEKIFDIFVNAVATIIDRIPGRYMKLVRSDDDDICQKLFKRQRSHFRDTFPSAVFSYDDIVAIGGDRPEAAMEGMMQARANSSQIIQSASQDDSRRQKIQTDLNKVTEIFAKEHYKTIRGTYRTPIAA